MTAPTTKLRHTLQRKQNTHGEVYNPENKYKEKELRAGYMTNQNTFDE